MSIPVTNLSVNPARSTGPAMVVGGWALSQLRLFRVAPLAGALLGASVYKWLTSPLPPHVVEPGLRAAPVGPVEEGKWRT